MLKFSTMSNIYSLGPWRTLASLRHNGFRVNST